MGDELTLEVRDLTKSYGNYDALRGVSFNLKKGEILGFLGPNGAGKTTTMRIITGFMPPTSGTAVVAGYDVLTHSIDVRKRIGYLPESVPLYTDMTVWDYVDFAARLRGVQNREDAIERVLDKTNLTDRADTLIAKLSKGYRQRVGIAQAMVHEPDVLILDEPTIGLDPKQIIEIRELIKSFGGEHTVILSTHILPEVSQTCSRVLIINQGKIVAEDTPERLTSLIRGQEHVHLQVSKPASEIKTELEKIKGILGVTAGNAPDVFEIEMNAGADHRADIAAMAVNRGWGVLEMRPVSVSLEQVFLQLTKSDEVEAA